MSPLLVLTHPLNLRLQLALAQGGGGGPGLPRHGIGVPPSPQLYLWLLLAGCHLYNLLWDRQVWNGMRVTANEVLVQGKVRDETQGDQFNRLNKKQQQEMKKFKRILIGPTKFA